MAGRAGPAVLGSQKPGIKELQDTRIRQGHRLLAWKENALRGRAEIRQGSDPTVLFLWPLLRLDPSLGW